MMRIEMVFRRLVTRRSATWRGYEPEKILLNLVAVKVLNYISRFIITIRAAKGTHNHILFSQEKCKYFNLIYSLFFKITASIQVFQSKLCMNFPSPPCLLHIPSILSSVPNPRLEYLLIFCKMFLTARCVNPKFAISRTRHPVGCTQIFMLDLNIRRPTTHLGIIFFHNLKLRETMQ